MDRFHGSLPFDQKMESASRIRRNHCPRRYIVTRDCWWRSQFRVALKSKQPSGPGVQRRPISRILGDNYWRFIRSNSASSIMSSVADRYCFPVQPRRRKIRFSKQCREQFFEAVEDDLEAVLDPLHAEWGGQMRLPGDPRCRGSETSASRGQTAPRRG